MKNRNTIAILLIIIAGIVARIVGAESGWYNFAPIAAIGLFSGSVISNKKLAFAVALLAQFAADIYFELFTQIPGFYGVSQWFTYGALILITFLGMSLKNRKALPVASFTIAGTLLFFVVSNLGVFAQGFYGYHISGLAQTYVMAIPFLKFSLLGDLLGSALFFGTYALSSGSVFTRLKTV